MLLKPFEDEEQDLELLPPARVPSGITSILHEVGLADPPELEETDPSKHVQEIFKNAKAGVAEAAKQLGTLLVAADNDNVKVKCAELILKANKVFTDDDKGPQRQPINITIVGSGNKTLINVLLPT